MDIRGKIYLVLEAIAPHGFPDSLIRSFTEQFLQLLYVPSRTPTDLEQLISEFKRNTRFSPSSERLWSKLEGFVRPIFTMSNDSEIVTFIDQFYARLQEELQSPVRERSGLNFELNKHNLDRHDQYISPIRPNLPSVYAESFETVDRLSDRKSLYSLHYGQTLNQSGISLPMGKLVEPLYANTIPEDEILRSVFYTLLGTTSDMFPIKSHTIHIPNAIPNSTSGMLHLIFEAGLLYMTITNKLEQSKNVHISPMKKALLTKINEYLYDYTRYVNSLSNMREIRSLKGLYNKLYDPILQLRIYEKFLTNFETTRGDEYLTRFHSYKTHGNILVQRISKDLYKSTITFYYDYMLKWLTSSKLESAFEEFFIEYNSDQMYIPYRLNKEKVPNFLPTETAKQTFIVGKTYIYLTQYCNELQSANKFSQKYSKIYNQLSNDQNNLQPFFKIIQEQYHEIVDYMWHILLTKQHFKETIHMLRDVLLMGKNDLIDSVIKNGKAVLDEQSSALNSYAYTRVLETAIQQSSLRNYYNRYDSNVLINRVDSRVLDLGQKLRGWDVFTLEYDIPPPLSIMLNVNRSDGRKEYLRIFNFLWRFKRTDYICNTEMMKTKELLHSFKNLRMQNSMVRDILNKLSKMSVLRSQMHIFNNVTQRFYFQSIIDKAFKQLEHDLYLNSASKDGVCDALVTLTNGLSVLGEPLKPVVDIFGSTIADESQTHECTHPKINMEEIDAIHNKFLTEILQNPLLSSQQVASYSGKAYPTSLIEILETIMEFMSLFSQLHEIVHELFVHISLQAELEELSDRLENFSQVSINMVRHYNHFKQQSHIFIKDLRSDKDESLNKLSKTLR